MAFSLPPHPSSFVLQTGLVCHSSHPLLHTTLPRHLTQKIHVTNIFVLCWYKFVYIKFETVIPRNYINKCPTFTVQNLTLPWCLFFHSNRIRQVLVGRGAQRSKIGTDWRSDFFNFLDWGPELLYLVLGPDRMEKIQTVWTD